MDVGHSWNSPHRIANFFLFKLQRHSDHHVHGMKPYQFLRNFEESPHLPTGYAGMVILSLFSPVYFRVMDDLIDAYNDARKDFESRKKRVNPTHKRSLLAEVFVLSFSAVVTACVFRR